MRNHLLVTSLFACVPSSAFANSPSDTISAADPAGIVMVLENAGYDPVLGKDGVGDPKIDLEIGGWSAGILFYGCDESTHDNCDSIQLRMGFDRKNPWTAEQAMEISKKYRFAAVELDEDGDPFLFWDIITKDGIPTKVFLASLMAFGQTVQDASNLAFADEETDDGAEQD